MGDDDPRLAISGLQKFEGEDLLAGDRKKLQLAQQASWCKQQMAEKAAVAAQDKEEDKAFASLLAKQEDYQTQVCNSEAMARKDYTYSVAADNKALAMEKKSKETAFAEMTLAMNTNEQANKLSDDMLGENRGSIGEMMTNARDTSVYLRDMAEKLRRDPSIIVWGTDEDDNAADRDGGSRDALRDELALRGSGRLPARERD